MATLVATTEAPLEDPAWWLTTGDPPHVTLQGPAGPLRGETMAAIVREPLERTRVVAATVDGSPATVEGSRVVVDTATLPDGPHRVEVTVRDTSLRQNHSTAVWSFVSDNSAPGLEVRAEPAEGIRDGTTLLVRLRSEDPAAQLGATLGDRELRLQPDGSGGFWAVAGVPPEPPYRALSLQVRGMDPLGNAASREVEVPVLPSAFAEDDLELGPELARLLTPDALAAEAERFLAVYRAPDGPKRWDGPFRLPVEAPVTTEFGTRRSYENHPGTDFAAPMGTPVRAPAAGTVAWVAETPLHGTVLVISHGAGVYTTYAHLQRVDVRAGAAVEAGQPVAAVGSTGLSTGPHLHWELWVAGAPVDPFEWTRRAFP